MLSISDEVRETGRRSITASRMVLTCGSAVGRESFKSCGRCQKTDCDSESFGGICTFSWLAERMPAPRLAEVERHAFPMFCTAVRLRTFAASMASRRRAIDFTIACWLWRCVPEEVGGERV